MVILEKGKYIVSIPEMGLWQDIHPEKSQLPFQSKEEAEQWEAAFVIRANNAKQAYQAACDLAMEQALAAVAAKEAESAAIDVITLKDEDFKRIVLKALGYKVKEA
ncbi:MAG TPA: hypothetical protein VLL97_01715 [Acidobacteriota bacterium]|nr:hypothetical protein [Acidobacteriota bacterium]